MNKEYEFNDFDDMLYDSLVKELKDWKLPLSFTEDVYIRMIESINRKIYLVENGIEDYE